MKWTITYILYAFFGCVLATGLLHEVNMHWLGNAFGVVDAFLIAIALLKFLNGDHLS